MPRVKRRLLQSRSITADTVRALLSGNDYFGAFGQRGEHGTDSDEARARMQATWEAIEPDVLRKFVEAFPGHRPWCWWAFTAPAERQHTIGLDEDEPELEVDFLIRHGLLEPGELEAIQSNAATGQFDAEERPVISWDLVRSWGYDRR